MRFTQLAVALDAEGNESLYALSDDGVIYERASVHYGPGKNYQGHHINKGMAYTPPFWRKVELPFAEPPLNGTQLSRLELQTEE